MWRQIISLVTNPWVGFALAAIVLVVGWKMAAPGANALLVAAWAILVVSVYRTPLLASLETMPRVLVTALLASALGLGLYYTLWTKTGRIVLDIVATTSAAERPAGDNIGGIPWSNRYADLRVTIRNISEVDYDSVDLVLVPDVPIMAAAQLSGLPGVWMDFHQIPAVTAEWQDSSGSRTAIPHQLLASSRGYSLRVDKLPAHGRLELVMAAVAIRDEGADGDVDKLIAIGFEDGMTVWLAHPNHSAVVFEETKPVPRRIVISGQYIAGGRTHRLSLDLVVLDLLLGKV